MGYDPETLVYSFPHYDGWLNRLSPFIGFDVWHIDPERPNSGNRTDDSCGWFDRTPGEYADSVKYLLDDQTFMHDVKLILYRKVNTLAPFYEGISEEQISYPRLSAADTLAACLMVANQLELRRWWNGQGGNGGAHASRWRKLLTKRRNVADVATDLALNPLDNFSSVESVGSLVRLMAAALNREFRPWWKHPRWHVHHWEINFTVTRNLRRMLIDKCAGCGKRLGWNTCPTSSGGGILYHGDCYGQAAVAKVPA